MTHQKQWYELLYETVGDYERQPSTQNTKAEVDFIERVIDHDTSKRILDVGCGTGRHSIELARRGYDVVGIDLSDAMIEHARQAAMDADVDVKFIVVDARMLEYRKDFDVAIILCEGAFSLMETDAMDRLILYNVTRALKRHGTLIMTAPNAAYVLAGHTHDGTFDPVSFRETFTMEVATGNGGTREMKATQRYYTCPELQWALRDLGYGQIEFFAVTDAGYDETRQPTPEQFELGVIARK